MVDEQKAACAGGGKLIPACHVVGMELCFLGRMAQRLGLQKDCGEER